MGIVCTTYKVAQIHEYCLVSLHPPWCNERRVTSSPFTITIVYIHPWRNERMVTSSPFTIAIVYTHPWRNERRITTSPFTITIVYSHHRRPIHVHQQSRQLQRTSILEGHRNHIIMALLGGAIYRAAVTSACGNVLPNTMHSDRRITILLSMFYNRVISHRHLPVDIMKTITTPLVKNKLRAI